MKAARKEREDAAMRTAMANKEQGGGVETSANNDTNYGSYPYPHHDNGYYHQQNLNISAVPYGHQPQTSMPMHPSYGTPINADPPQHGPPAAYYPSGAPPPAPQQPDSSGMSDQRHDPPYSIDPDHRPPTSAPYYYHKQAHYHYGGQQSYAPHQYPPHTGGTPDQDINKSHAGKFFFFHT
jgi:hypothetical protein